MELPVTILSITGLPIKKNYRVFGGFQWLGSARQRLSMARFGSTVAFSSGVGCRRGRRVVKRVVNALCVDRVRRMTIAWLGCLCTFSKPVPQASSSHTLPYSSFALSVFSAYHVSWRCAPQRKGCQGRSGQHKANLPITVSEEAYQNANQSCGVRTDPARRPVGPSSSLDESLKLKPLAAQGS